MNYIILIFAVLMVLGGIVLLLNPGYIFTPIKKYVASPWLHFFAIIVRLVFGIVLLIAAAESKYPCALQVFGWLLISTALVLAIIGRARFQVLIKWALKLSPLLQQLAAVFAVLLGGFLIYSVV